MSAADVDAKLASLDDWRGETLSRLRAAILAAEPGIEESIKWRKANNPGGVPVWETQGILCAGEAYKDKVKLTFMQGAALDDPAGLFNADDKGATRRAIDLREGEAIDAAALTALVREAVASNAAKAR